MKAKVIYAASVCMILSAAIVVLITMNLHQYWTHGWGKLAIMSVIAIPVMAIICGIMSRRQACKTTAAKEKKS